MHSRAILRVIGILLMLFSVSQVPPTILCWVYQDCPAKPYVLAFLLTLVSGVFAWLIGRGAQHELKNRDGFLIVVLFWLVLCFFAAIPLMLADKPHDTLTDAMFESVSGFTTTGATLVHGVEHLSHAMRYYRQQLQFIGGMGIIVLAVAILPMLGIGGLQMYRAETPGPVKDSKLTPRLTSTAKTLWSIYLGLTMLCAVAYWLAGMDVFNAIGESFATISTGGFAMHDASFAYYHSLPIELLATIFMLLGATNFSLHYLVLIKQRYQPYWQDEEFRCYLAFLAVIVGLVVSILLATDIYRNPEVALVKTLFNVISLSTTTGFVSAEYYQWPSFIPMLMMVIALIGGCASSTSGGMKFIRVLLLYKQCRREVKRLVHPQAVINLKFAGRVMPEQILQSMWGFIAAYLGLFVVLLLILLADGSDLTTAFGALTACLANVGVGIGQHPFDFYLHSDVTKWVCIFAMLAGRLEIFSLLVILSPDFWRK